MFKSNQFKTIHMMLLFVLCVAGQSEAKDSKSCLWKVETGSNRVYLLGSVHMLKAEHYPLPEVMESAFEDAEQVIFEIHPDSAESPAAQFKMMRMGLLPEGETLKSSLHDTVYALLDEKAGDVGFNLDLSQQMKPWMIGIMIAMSEMNQAGILPEYGVDKYYFKKSREAGKKVAGLESVDFQLELFDSFGSGDQNEFLLHILNDLGLIESQLEEVITAWSTGDVTALEDLLMSEFEDSPEIYERLVVERNENWMKEIKQYLKSEEDYLVVVGAAHLFGKDGILSKLKAAGYEVEQL